MYIVNAGRKKPDGILDCPDVPMVFILDAVKDCKYYQFIVLGYGLIDAKKQSVRFCRDHGFSPVKINKAVEYCEEPSK